MMDRPLSTASFAILPVKACKNGATSLRPRGQLLAAINKWRSSADIARNSVLLAYCIRNDGHIPTSKSLIKKCLACPYKHNLSRFSAMEGMAECSRSGHITFVTASASLEPLAMERGEWAMSDFFACSTIVTMS